MLINSIYGRLVYEPMTTDNGDHDDDDNDDDDEVSAHLVDGRRQHPHDIREDSDLFGGARKLRPHQTAQVHEHISTRDHLDGGRVGRPQRTDARQRPRGVDDARRSVAGALEDGDEAIDEADKPVDRRRRVDASVDERPQSVAPRLFRRGRRFERRANNVEKFVDGRLGRTGVVDQHKTEHRKCALVHLTTT